MGITKSIHITKLDAARRQLETAIRLYFQEQDPISIHTLAAAAYNILRDVNRDRRGAPMFVKERFLEFVKPEALDLVRKTLNESENFFKHANRDPNSTYEFHPDETAFLILDAGGKYHEFTGEDPPLIHLFRVWFLMHHPDLFNLPPRGQKAMASLHERFGTLPRRAFFMEALPPIMALGATEESLGI